MIEQLEQLKINADNINSVLSKKRGALRSIKLERKRLLIKQTEDKKRKIKEKKLESRKSPFGKSIQKIKKSTSTNTIFKNFGGNLLKFASLLLLGVALNNIDAIKEAVDKAFKNIREGLKTISDVIKTIYDKTENFINMFDSDVQKNNDFDKLEEEYKGTEPILKDLETMSKAIQDAMAKLTDSQFGNTLDSGSLSDGREFDLINLFNEETGKDEAMFRIRNPDGTFENVFQTEVNKNLIKQSQTKIPNLMQEFEQNQWWDVFDQYPNKVKYIEVFNPTKDFDPQKELERLQAIDSERYSDTEIRIQPVYIDPD